MICENIKAIKIGTGSRKLGKTNNHERNRKCYQSSFKRLQAPPPSKKKASGPHSQWQSSFTPLHQWFPTGECVFGGVALQRTFSNVWRHLALSQFGGVGAAKHLTLHRTDPHNKKVPSPKCQQCQSRETLLYTFKEKVISMLCTTFQHIGKEGELLKAASNANITLIPKYEKYQKDIGPCRLIIYIYI